MTACEKPDFPGDTCDHWFVKYGQMPCDPCRERIARQAAVGAAVERWLRVMMEQECRLDQHYELHEAPMCEQHASEWPRGNDRCEGALAIAAALGDDQLMDLIEHTMTTEPR